MSRPVVRLGFAAPLSGPQAIVGEPMSRCAHLAVDEANDRGDLPFELRLWAEDDLATPVGARAVASRFVADPTVLGVIGHKNSGPSASGAPLYDAAGLAQMTPSSTNSALSQQGYRTFFRVCAHDAIQGQVAAQYAVRVLGARRVVVLHDQTDYGYPLGRVVAATVPQEGAEVVLFEGIQEGGQDFSETVSRIQRLQPDLVYFALTEIESSILARQLRQAGVNATLFGTDGSLESQFLPLAGAAAEGVYQTYAGLDMASAPSAWPFVERYRARYGEPPVYGAEVYDATCLLIEAITRASRRALPLDLQSNGDGGGMASQREAPHYPAGAHPALPTRRAVLAALRQLDDFVGVSGPIAFDSVGDRINPTITLWCVIEGRMVLLGTADVLIPQTVL